MKATTTFTVIVTRVNNPTDYSYSSSYDIEASTGNDAAREAKERFCSDFGAPPEAVKTNVVDREVIEYRLSLTTTKTTQHGTK